MLVLRLRTDGLLSSQSHCVLVHDHASAVLGIGRSRSGPVNGVTEHVHVGSGQSRTGEVHRLCGSHAVDVNPGAVCGGVHLSTVQITQAASGDGVTIALECLLGEAGDTTQHSSFHRGNDDVQLVGGHITVFHSLDHLAQAGVSQCSGVAGGSAREQSGTVAADDSFFVQVGRASDGAAVERGTQHVQVTVNLLCQSVASVIRVELAHGTQGLHLSNVFVQFAVLVVLVDQDGDLGGSVCNQGHLGVRGLAGRLTTPGDGDVQCVALFPFEGNGGDEITQYQLLLIRGDDLIGPEFGNELVRCGDCGVISAEAHDKSPLKKLLHATFGVSGHDFV